jgi:hypothetical protein
LIEDRLYDTPTLSIKGTHRAAIESRESVVSDN